MDSTQRTDLLASSTSNSITGTPEGHGQEDRANVPEIDTARGQGQGLSQRCFVEDPCCTSESDDCNAEECCTRGRNTEGGFVTVPSGHRVDDRASCHSTRSEQAKHPVCGTCCEEPIEIADNCSDGCCDHEPAPAEDAFEGSCCDEAPCQGSCCDDDEEDHDNDGGVSIARNLNANQRSEAGDEDCQKSCCGEDSSSVIEEPTLPAQGCQKGCCAETPKPLVAQIPPTEACQKGYCNEKSKPVAAQSPSREPCQKGCCSEKPKSLTAQTPSTEPCTKGCCSEKLVPLPVQAPPTEACQKGCCSERLKPSVVQIPQRDACQKGCCSENPQPVIATPPPTDVCQKGCCSENLRPPVAQTLPREACQKGCCSETLSPAIQEVLPNACQKGCCEQKPKTVVVVNDGNCKKGCCGGEPVLSEKASMRNDCQEDCCGGTSNPFEVETDELDRYNKDCCSEDSVPLDEDFLPDPCECCLEVTLQDAGILALPQMPSSMSTPSKSCCPPSIRSTSTAPLISNATVEQLQMRLATLKRCCAMLDDCCRKACCMLSLASTNPERKARDALPLASAAGGSSAAQTGEKLVLSIRGMDCPGCTRKLSKALSGLPSVTVRHVDYFQAKAEVYHDPETITPEAVAKYVARATGFTITPVAPEKADAMAGARTVLRVRFNTPPPSDAVPGATIENLSGSVFEVSFNSDGMNGPGAREILASLEAYGPQLVRVQGEDDNRAKRDFHDVLLRTFIAAVCCIPVLVLAWAPLKPRPTLYGAISLGFTTMIQIAALPIISGALRTLFFLRSLDMHLLVAVSTTTAYVFSIIAYAYEVVHKPLSESFFETSALLVTLIYVGRAVQAGARSKTGSALQELHKLQTTEVLLLETDGSTRSIDVRLLHHGDIIRIGPDSRVATDGVVISGASEVDESSVTGETMPVAKWEGSKVVAGTLNLNGTLDVKITCLAHENSLTSIARLVEEAQSSRSPVQDLADKVAAYILPIALTIAAITFLVWTLVNIFVRKRSTTASCVDALTYAIAVIVVTCPCAIGLAVPIVIAVAMRIGAKRGVLFKSVAVLQVVPSVDTVIFDKTGTLTAGQLEVKKAEVLVPGTEKLIRALLSSSKHPIAKGVLAYVGSHATIDSTILSTVTSIPGKGMEAQLGTLTLRAGNPTFAQTASHPIVQSMQSEGMSVLCVSLSGTLLAAYGLVDSTRNEAHDLIAELRRRGKDVYLLSGDNTASVQQVASSVGILGSQAISHCKPAQKQAFIRELQAKGRKVLFLGDGTNDSIAMSQADCGVAVCSSTDVALSSAGAVLLRHDLRALLTLMDLAEAAFFRIKLNFAWCIIYNVFAVLLASGATVGARIAPQWAGLGELVSVLPVIFFGLQLGWVKFD